ncbi:hypothetical protein HanIR_Chr09g0420431 [Helianthus annuus]|nr:hypothetical protein HanIR_Chr09g0420431 [Helianthus annuus]
MSTGISVIAIYPFLCFSIDVKYASISFWTYHDLFFRDTDRFPSPQVGLKSDIYRVSPSRVVL